MLDPYILSPVLNSLSFGIWEFHLRMRQICRPKLYNYPHILHPIPHPNYKSRIDQRLVDFL
jgi:hypothetical protein